LEVLMGERTLRGARLGGQSFEDERGIEFAARQQVGYRCAQGHEFEITMSVEADVPALWECPRCGAEGRATSGIEPELKAEKPAALTGTCCSSAAPSRSSRTSSPSASSCSEEERSVPHTCTARASARSGPLPVTDASLRRRLVSFRWPFVDNLALDHLVVGVSRPGALLRPGTGARAAGL